MNITIQYPQPSNTRIWGPPACYLTVCFVILICALLIQSQSLVFGHAQLNQLYAPLVILLATTLIWTMLRFTLRRVHSVILAYLLHANRLCELRYFRAKAILRLRNQIIASVVLGLLGCWLFDYSEFALLSPVGLSIAVFTFIFSIISCVFMMQCLTLPGFLKKHFYSENIDSLTALKTALMFLTLNHQINAILCSTLFIWALLGALLTECKLFCLLVSALSLTILLFSVFANTRIASQISDYQELALTSTDRKLYFLRNKGRYPEQARQVAITKLTNQRHALSQCDCTAVPPKVRDLLFGALLCMFLSWLLFT